MTKKKTVNTIVPDNEEYYTSDLDRRENKNSDQDDIAIDSEEIDAPKAKTSSLYNGHIVETRNETDVEYTDLGGTIDRSHVIDQDKTSTEVGEPGHPGIDADTG